MRSDPESEPDPEFFSPEPDPDPWKKCRILIPGFIPKERTSYTVFPRSLVLTLDPFYIVTDWVNTSLTDGIICC